jgi:hypothetical protein
MVECRARQTRSRLAGWLGTVPIALVVAAGLAAAPAALAAPHLSRTATLTAPGRPGDTPLAASVDGSTVVLGGSNRAYVFSGAPSASPSVTPLARGFASFVAISGDGSTVAVGSGSKRVAVYRRVDPAHAFERVATLLTAGRDPVLALAISYHGGRIFVLSKSVEVFFRGSSGYKRAARLRVKGSPHSLVAANDGTTLALSNGSDVTVLQRPAGGKWARATRRKVVNGDQHTSVALDGHGTTLAVGKGKGDAQSGLPGSVDVFTRTGNSWRTGQPATATLTPEHYVVSAGDVPDGVGHSVSLNPDGSEIVAGAAIVPRALVFQRSVSGWVDGHEVAQADIPGKKGPWQVAGSLGTGVIVSDRASHAHIFR